MANFQPIPWLKVSDDVGLPLAGGKIWTYQSGTTTPKTTYTDTALTVANTNPILLNTRGEAQMALAPGAYSFKLLRADDTLIKTIDNVTDGAAAAIVLSAAGVALVRADLADTGGSALVGYIAAGASAVARTQQDKSRDVVSVWDYMTAAQIADVKARSKLVDVSAAINNAINQLAATGGGDLLFPSGDYRTNTSIVLKDQVTLCGAGVASRTHVALSPTRIFHYGNNPGVLAQTPTLMGEFCLRGLEFNGLNAGASASGLVMDAHSGGGALVGTKAYDCTFCNFPNYQVLQNGTVFDNTFESCTFHSYGRVSGDTYHIGPNGNPTQQTFINCFFISNTTGWSFRTESGTNPRFIGGTIGPAQIDGNGISALGGLFLYGTHIEALGGSTSSIGILYKGSTGAFISPAECILFAKGIQIGDGGSDTARGWTIAGCVGANTQYDVLITSGGPRNGTLCEIGYIGGSRIIYDQRAAVDKAYEVARADSTSPNYQGTFTPIVIGSTTSGAATYSQQYGIFEVVGKMLSYTLRVQYSGHTGAGSLQITGFPNNSGGSLSTPSFRVSGLGRNAGTQLTGYVSGNTFNVEQSGIDGSINPVVISAAADLIITGQYFLG